MCILYVYSHPTFEWESKMKSICASIFSGEKIETAAFFGRRRSSNFHLHFVGSAITYLAECKDA